jgi:membrane protein YdbS with pleckstrin-like domain
MSDAAAAGPPAGAAPPPVSADWTALDARVVGLWRLTTLIGLGVLAAAASIPVVPLLLALDPPGLLLAALGALAFVLAAVLVLWYPARAFRAWSFRLDERVLETRSGVVFHVTRLVPLTRLQHVDLQVGPLERMHGLSSLVLHTAGTRQASITIPGLRPDLAARLRDHLVMVGGDDGV